MKSIVHPESCLLYFKRVGAEIVNFRRAVVRTYINNYPKEMATIRISDDGDVTCPKEDYAPTKIEFEQMKADLQGITFPKFINATNTDFLKGPTGIIHPIYNQATGEIIMVHERQDLPDGKKRCFFWSFMDNGEWVCMQRDGPVPFWKPQVSMGNNKPIMIHEGIKAAEWVINGLKDPNWNHPWAAYLRIFEHWALLGGSFAAHRANYKELDDRNPPYVVYACDHDRVGEAALQMFSKHWKKHLKGLVFGNDFPKSWDMADPIPEELFSAKGRYKGPTAQSLLVPATWATEIVPPVGKGRPGHKISEEFAAEWFHCITPEVFIHKDWPGKIYSTDEFDNFIRPFSDIAKPSNLLKTDFSGQSSVLRYDPGKQSGNYSGSTQGRYVNTYCPSDIKEEEGDPEPWFDFLQHFIIDDKDRHEFKRFFATLVARPQIRMNYGVLMVSEEQGVGKGTVSEKIAAPLMGLENVSFPSEQVIVDSNYNYWLAHKRLAVIHEIYAGNSSKAYNKLKSIITDNNVHVQKKYQADYDIECWIHIMACSNSKQALKISQGDRRWFVPKITSEKRSAAFWSKFNTWLTEEGGLGIIKRWCREFIEEDSAHIVRPGVEAPSSSTKEEIIREGYSAGQLLIERTLTQIKELVDEGKLPATTFVVDLDLVQMIKDQLYEGRQVDKLERPRTVRAVAQGMGWHIGETQAQVAGWGFPRRGARVIAIDPDIAAKMPKDLGGVELPEAQRLRPLDLKALSEF